MITKSLVIWCDVCTQSIDTGEQTMKETRKKVKSWGWIFEGGKDICDNCHKKGDEVKPTNVTEDEYNDSLDSLMNYNAEVRL